MDTQYQALLSQLETERAFFHRVVDHIPAGVIIAEHPSGRLLVGNAQVEAIWRHPYLPSANIAEYGHWRGFHADGRPYRPEEWPLARSVLTGEVVNHEEIRIERGDGSSGIIRVSSSPVYNQERQIIAGVVVFYDITELTKAAQEHLRLLERERLARQEAERIAERMTRLQAITTQLSEALTLNQVAEVILEQGRAALQARDGLIGLLDGSDASFELLRHVGYAPEIVAEFQRFPLGARLPLSDAVRQGRPVLLRSLQERQARYPELAAAQSRTGPGALAALPLVVHGRAIGGLGFSFEVDRDFPAEDQAFLLALAQQCAQALERARLYEAEHQARVLAERLAERMSRLQQITAALAQTRSFAEVAEAALQAVGFSGGAAVAIGLVVDDGQTLEFVKDSGFSTQPEGWRRIPLSLSTPITDAVRSRTPIWLASQAARAARYPHLDTLQFQIGGGALAALPLLMDGRAIGAMVLLFPQDQQLPEEERNFLLNVAQQTAHAIERLRLYEAERQARLEAEAALQARDQFFSAAAHELNTPVTTVLGYAQLLQRRLSRTAALQPGDQRALDGLTYQVSRLQRLVHALLDLSRLQAGQLALERQVIELNSMLTHLLEQIRPIFLSHRIELQEADQALLVYGDAARLEQAIYNLVQNAVKYSSHGSTILITLEQQEQNGCITIHDQGIGIPSRSLDQIFTLFYRGDNVNPAEIAGIGIGLYLVQQLVRLHGGRVQVASRVGEGSSFQLQLPRYVDGL